MDKLDVQKLMLELENKSIEDRVDMLFKEGHIDKGLYTLLNGNLLQSKIHVYRIPRETFFAKQTNKILLLFYKFLFKVLEPVLQEQDKINRLLVMEIIKIRSEK